MTHRMGKFFSRLWSPESGPYALLVIVLVTAFVLAPLLSARLVAPLILEVAFSLILVSGAFSLSSRTSVRLIALIFGLLSPSMRWLGETVSGKAIFAADILISVGMLVFFVGLIFAGFVVKGRATGHRIVGAVTVYLMLGIVWARLFEVVELLSPGSFRTPEGETLNPATLTYFSFVTLATMGYGDISPVNIVARNLAVLEAVTGQLMLVILISRLVAEGSEESEKDQGG
ncbi:MAG: potassium channel family protein [Syntrophobacteraceae bacterium]